MLLSLCAVLVASDPKPSQEPVIVIAGDNPLKLSPSDEEYIDPGASCSSYPDHAFDVNIDPHMVDLTKEGVYHVEFTCRNDAGLRADKMARVVIVDKKNYEDLWWGDSEVQIGGYTVHTFDATKRVQLATALSNALDIPSSALRITKVVEPKDASTDVLPIKLSDDSDSIVVEFRETLMLAVVNRMGDEKFSSILTQEMQGEGLVGARVESTSATKFKEAATTTALAGLAAGGVFAMVVLIVGFQKIKQLRHNQDAGYSPVAGA